MPEGPEIRRAADRVQKALAHLPVMEIFFAFPQLKGYESLLQGTKITRVDTKGKAMLIRFDNGYTMYSHNQLYGRWYVKKAFEYPKTNRQLRVAIHNEKKSALLYSASDIEVMRDEEVHLHPFIARVGPDILSEDVTSGDILTRMEAFRKRKWAHLLLDQGFVAGIGNYLRSEILFVSGIHPTLRPMDCSNEQLTLAADAIIHLMKQSYETAGITNDLQLVEKLKQEGLTRSRYRHWVFNREGASCYRCGTEIEKIMAASRRLYYCPHCQSK